jgi:hypothetical protein
LRWLDESGIETFESISQSIERELAYSQALLAFYSREYPARRACQWELTAAFLAAQRAGVNPRRRVLVVNPKDGAGHVQPVELRDALYAGVASTADAAGYRALAEQIAKHVRGLDGVLGILVCRPARRGGGSGLSAQRGSLGVCGTCGRCIRRWSRGRSG